MVALSAILVATAALVAVAEPAAAVPGRVVVLTTGPTDSSTVKSVAAQCPTGTVPLGGGGKVVGGAHSVRIVRSIPFKGGSWFVTAWEDSYGYAGSWSIETWVVCAPAPPGYEIVSATSVSDVGTPFSFALVSCPAGKKVIGAGGNSFKGGSVLELIGPNASLTNVAVQAIPDEVAYPAPGTMMTTATAVCVNPVTGQQRVEASSAWDSSSNKTVTAICPPGTALHGLGFGLGFGVVPWAEAQLVSVMSIGNGVSLNAAEDSTGNSATWIARAWAICAV